MKILEITEIPKKTIHLVSYISKDNEDRNMVNGSRNDIYLTSPGSGVREKEGFHVVVSSGSLPAGSGYLLKMLSGGAVLKIREQISSNYLSMEVSVPGFISTSDSVKISRIMKICVLTVSDKGSAGQREDKSGPALETLMKDTGSVVLSRDIVPDSTDEINRVIRNWTGTNGVDLILVTGGTGLSERDVTPEALSEICSKKVPGISEYMRMKTSVFTERSILSRSGAYVIDNTLVLSLPGSKKGAIQSLAAVLPVLEHAVDVVKGSSQDCGS